MEGPYRDLGSGFARLTGIEGSRRGPSRINTVEDALMELVRNARDAGADNVYVASILHARRYRSLTVLDDGRGIPVSHRDVIFEPGVTTRHLNPVSDAGPVPHGAGLSLYHIRRFAVDAAVASPDNPTAIRATFDTLSLPERTLQSGSRPSRSNLEATLRAFLRDTPSSIQPPNLYLASPARILATLLNNRIIPIDALGDGTRGGVVREVSRFASGCGIEVSPRTVQRVVGGEIAPVAPVSGRDEIGGKARAGGENEGERSRGGPSLMLGPEEVREIWAILDRSARASYLGVGEVVVEARAGGIVLKAAVFEPEDEYE